MPRGPELEAALAEAEIHCADGVCVIYDRARVGAYDASWFDAARWRGDAEVVHSTKGRGSVLKRVVGGEPWVLRHYHRGGLVSSFIYDHYLWLGLERTRAFREWRLLHALHARGLPVPEPLAARVERAGPIYQADIALAYLAGTRTLSSHLDRDGITGEQWLEIGRMLRRFHDHGVDHPDLTAHNILIDADGRLFLVDFDNAFLRPQGAWQARGMDRLQRSLRKVALETGTEFDAQGWDALRRGYDA